MMPRLFSWENDDLYPGDILRIGALNSCFLGKSNCMVYSIILNNNYLISPSLQERNRSSVIDVSS